MKNILGHKSYSSEEIVNILSETGSYTCPVLPHYRYDRVKRICNDLVRRKLLKKSGSTSCGVNLVITSRFKEWLSEYKSGLTTLHPIKWQKKKYPIVSLFKKRPCKGCGINYIPTQITQKRCHRGCR